MSNAAWSPDSTSVAYLAHTDDATHIWIADVATGKSRQLTKTPVLATLVSSFEFTADGKQIAAVLIPDGRAAMPPAPTAPDGPTVKIADSDKNRLRTFPSLMSTTYEKQLLEWHATGQVAFIDVQKGVVKKVGQPVMVRSVDASPDGKYLRVTQMTQAVLVRRAGQQLRAGRGNVGRRRKDAREVERPRRSISACRTTRSPPRIRRRPAAAAAAPIRQASATWRGGPMARA